MAFTKINAAGIGTTETVTVDGLTVINDGSFGGNLSVGGTITYEDVTNVDSVGIITARAGIVVGSGITLSKDGHGFFTGVITATSYAGSGANLTGIDTDLVSDTSPQLGGDLDTNNFEILLDDNHAVKFGDDIDLTVLHSGSTGVINNVTGDLHIKTTSSGDDIVLISNDDIELQPQAGESGIKVIGNGAVELYYDNSKTFETTSGGVSVTGDVIVTSTAPKIDLVDSNANSDFRLKCDSGNFHIEDISNVGNRLSIDSSGDVIIHNDLDFPDNSKIKLGTGDDLQIYHSGHSVVQNTNAAALLIASSETHIVNAALSENIAKFVGDGAVELYHNNSKVFETTSVGVNITGQSTFVRNSADANFIVGSTGANGAYLVLDGDSNGDAAGGDYAYLLHNSSGNLVIDTRNPGGNSRMQFNVNGSERLRIDPSGRLLLGTTTSNAPTGSLHVKNAYIRIQAANQQSTDFSQEVGIEWSQEEGSDVQVGKIVMRRDAWGGAPHNMDFYSRTYSNQVTKNMTIAHDGGIFFQNLLGNAASGSTVKYNNSDDELRYDTSSKLLKTNITELTKYGIDTVKKLKPSTFTPQEYNKDGTITVGDETLIGFIADEMVTEVPEVVQMYPKSTLTKQEEDTEIVPAAISYDKLTVVLTKALQEEIAKREALEARIAALEG